MSVIHVTGNDGREYNYPIEKDKIIIGRSKESDIVIQDSTVSRQHAQIEKTKEGFVVSDLGSFNGTIINGKSVSSVLLQHNDSVKIGSTILKFFAKKAPKPLATDSLILTPEDEEGADRQKIVERSSQTSQKGSEDLLVSPESSKSVPETAKGGRQESKIKSDLLSLERANKVLFVMYEISRQLNSIHNFNELLNKIMDLIFNVIDADYGFLVLTGEKHEEELTPVVVKYKSEQLKKQKQLKASRTLINKVIHDQVALLTSNAMDDSRLDHGKSLFLQQIRSAMCVPLWKKDKIIGVIQLDSIRLDNQFTNDDLELLKAIGSQMAMVIEQSSLNEQIRAEEQMRTRLERFHSPQVIDMILKGSQQTKDNVMEPQDVTATILFTDIIGFTRLSEQLPPREVNMLLNQYFSRMTDTIFKYDGTLDKYIGDALMAVFGAPIEKEDDAERAIMAAQEMVKELGIMMQSIDENKKFKIRVGINTGRIVAGNIGSPKRMEYTVIGDPVNTASRLETLAGPNQILIGEETYQLVKDKFTINEVGPRKVKGKRAEIMVYEVAG